MLIRTSGCKNRVGELNKRRTTTERVVRESYLHVDRAEVVGAKEKRAGRRMQTG